MKLAAQLQGQNDPFEGDRTLYIAGLPEGAQIVRASVRAQPELCTQEIIFNNGRGNWGATKELATPPVNSVAVDLHTRRTITHFRASATPAGSVNVQVDIGGVWARLAQDGTISPADENDVLAYALTPTPTRQALPPLTAQRLRLSTGAAAQNLDIQQLTVVSQPTNVQVRLDEMPPFWAKPGELSAPASSPDFAELLQTYLAEAVVEDGFYVIPLVVHSDSIACLSVTVEIEYLNQQSALPPGVAETKLTFDYGSLPKAEANLLEITLPVGARVIPGATTAQVTGAFAESRVVFGPTGEVTPEPQVLVNPGQSQAQPIQLGTNVAATAIDLLLAAQTRVAKLTLNLLGDTDGKPSNEPLLSAPVSIDLDREVAGSPTWISASLPVEFQFAAGVRYWLMLQSREGDALWSVHAESEAQIGLHFTNSGGLAWRATTANNLTAPVAAFFRLRHTPDRFQMPIELQIGVGDNAQRVSLARFEPLGRVDFQLDFDEVAAAINQFVEQASPPQSPQVEQLFNGDYTEWSVVGRKIMHPLATPTAQLLSPVAIAVSPGGQMLYVGGERPTLDDVGSEPPVTVGVVHFVATDCMTLAAEIVLPDATPLEMVVDPLRERLFVLAEGSTSAQTHRLFVIDTTQRTLIGDFHELNFEVNAIAISPDGFRLYLAGRAQTACNLLGHVRVVDTERLINALVSPAPANAPVSIADITLGEQHNPLALAVSPDGLFVYVATFNSLAGAGAQFGEIHVIHAATNSLAEEFIPVGDTLLDLAVTPDGAQIVAIGTETLPSEDEAGQVYFVNVRNGDVTPLLGALDATVLALPTSLGITPDGQRCLVADETTESLVIIDRARRRIEQTLPLSAHPTDLTLTQMGDWAYLPTATLAQLLPVAGNRDGLVAVPLGAPVPMEWTLTAGSVVPICFAEPFHRTAVLGLSAETHEPADTDSSLSQVVAVAPACTYEFNFWGRAIEAGAIAEIIWLGDGCGLLGVERLPVAVAQLPPANFAPSLPSGAETQPTLELHRLRVQSPAGAAQAEIRFSTPAGVVAVLDQVSLRGVLGVVQNGDFQVLEDGQLATWMLSPANATAVSVIAEADETRIQNQGRGQAALLQRFPVTPEQQFLLVAVGHNGGAQNAGVTPQLEVHWLKSDGAETGAPAVRRIDGADASQHSLAGQVPAGAAEAELRIVLPANTAVILRTISFQPVETIQVPITFVAEAPGELTLANFQVAYDIAAGPAPPEPANGLCTPTPATRTPGTGSHKQCFCPCCQAEKTLPATQPTMTPASRPAQSGSCPDCGATLVQPGGRQTSLSPSAGRLAVVRRSLQSSAPASRARGMRPFFAAERAVAPTLVTIDPPRAFAAPVSADITEVPGIAQARAAQLAAAGIASLPALAAASPAEIAQTLSGVSEQMASGFIEAAKEIVQRQTAAAAPLVSCIMPTYNRRPFVAQAIRYFLRQDYPKRQLIIVDDGTDSIQDLVPDDEQIRYIRLNTRRTTGAKRNIACQAADGEIILHWDDDDWMADWRVSYQIAGFLQETAEINGLANPLYYDLASRQAWQYRHPAGQRPWLSGGTLCYAKSFWLAHPFPDTPRGAETRFIWESHPKRLATLQNERFYVSILHAGNIGFRRIRPPYWHPIPTDEIKAVIGDDWPFYQEA